MSKINYKKPIIIFLVTFIPLILFAFLPGETRGYTKLLSDSLGFQMSYIFWMSTIASIIGSVFVGYALGPLFLAAHKYTVGIRMTYGIQKRVEPTKLKIGYKALFPALLALNLAFLFAPQDWVRDFVINEHWAQNNDIAAMDFLVVMITILPLMVGISFGIFSPVWFLLDAGIVFTNKEKVSELRDPIEIRSVGGWYHYILKGYAGISIIISSITFSDSVIKETGGFENGIFLVPLLPLLLVILAIPAFIFLEKTAKSRNKFMLKIAKALGIKDPLEDPLNVGKG